MDWNSPYITEAAQRALRQNSGLDRPFLGHVFPADIRANAAIVAQSRTILAGLTLAAKVFEQLDPAVHLQICAADGQTLAPDEPVLRIASTVAAILEGEHAALSLLNHLSTIATQSHALAQQLEGTIAKFRAPQRAPSNLERFEEYAVQIGGAGAAFPAASSTTLLTEAHVMAAGGVTAALDQAHSYIALHSRPQALTAYEAVSTPAAAHDASPLLIQIELRDETQLREALEAGASFVRLLHMDAATVHRCVSLARNLRPDCIIELVADLTVDNARVFAESGADFLAPITLPHQPLADFALLVENSR